MPTPTSATLNATTSRIIEAAIGIHRALGPGLLESAYLTCLARDLAEARVPFETQQAIPLVYKGIRVECAYRADLVVNASVLVEVKAIEAVAPVHIQQVYTYLRLGNYPIGLLLNFGVKTMKAGIKRVVNGFPDLRGGTTSTGHRTGAHGGASRQRDREGSRSQTPRESYGDCDRLPSRSRRRPKAAAMRSSGYGARPAKLPRVLQRRAAASAALRLSASPAIGFLS